MHDVLTSELDRDLVRAFVESGGVECRLNAMHRIWNIPTRRYFKRDHEKLNAVGRLAASRVQTASRSLAKASNVAARLARAPKATP